MPEDLESASYHRLVLDQNQSHLNDGTSALVAEKSVAADVGRLLVIVDGIPRSP
tara:strand:+ start:123 stop:284 length:162 start_codon:yes stop_codon:yes gene_type:complete